MLFHLTFLADATLTMIVLVYLYLYHKTELKHIENVTVYKLNTHFVFTYIHLFLYSRFFTPSFIDFCFL